MRVALLLAVLASALAVRAEYDDSFKCTVCTKIANYIIPVIREAGTDAADSICDNFSGDSTRSACGQVVGTGWQMIVNWVKYRKAGARDICVSLSFCENGGRDFEKEDAESGGEGDQEHGGARDGQERGHDGKGDDRSPSPERESDGRRGSTPSRDEDTTGADLDFDRIQQAEREHEAQVNSERGKRALRFRRHIKPSA